MFFSNPPFQLIDIEIIQFETFLLISFPEITIGNLENVLLYEEKLLLKEVSKGNEKAFRILYDRYFDRLAAFIFKLCKCETVTEEIVQDIFLKLWINRHLLDQLDCPKAYIFSMARNSSIDYFRRLARETNLISALSAQLQIANNDIEDRLHAKELRRLIEEAVDQLSAQKKKIFKLSKEEGLSHKEIAEVMQLSKSTVKNHLSETLQYVREHLSQQPNSEASLLLLLLITLR